MKNIDPKSVLIGVLATALVIACTDSSKPTSIIPEAKAATGKEDGGKWDDEQEWEFARWSVEFFIPFNKDWKKWTLETYPFGEVLQTGKMPMSDRKVPQIPKGWEPLSGEVRAGFNVVFLRRRIK